MAGQVIRVVSRSIAGPTIALCSVCPWQSSDGSTAAFLNHVMETGHRVLTLNETIYEYEGATE